MDADADAQKLTGVNDLEASSAVQDTDYTLSMVSAASGRNLVRVVDLDHAAVCELERKGFEWYFGLEMANLVNHRFARLLVRRHFLCASLCIKGFVGADFIHEKTARVNWLEGLLFQNWRASLKFQNSWMSTKTERSAAVVPGQAAVDPGPKRYGCI
jgi:hypothetical protein